MTTEERKRLELAKDEVTLRLSLLDISSYSLPETDPRLEEYTMEVAGNPERHNLWEQLAVERFFRMIDRYGLDSKAVKRFFTFYEYLYFPGKRGLRRYRLTPVQAFQFASVYGFRYPDGRRVVREAVLYVPRKFSKTTGSAAFAIYDLLYGDANAEAYVGANSQDQAKKCFDVIRGCMRRLDPDGRQFVINEQMVKPTRRRSAKRTAIAQCLTANARTKDGLNASTVIMDEFSQARDSTLLTVLTTSMGVRDNPLTVIITTASDVFDGPFYQMLAGYKRVLLGEYEDDTLFAHLFEPDVNDPEDLESTWRKVHPHYGITVNEDFYEHEYRKSQRDGAEAKLAFRTKLLNVYSENEQKSWIPAGVARNCARSFRIADIKGNPQAMVAMDLSVRDDFSAVTCGFYDTGRHRFIYHTKYFFPEGALTDHVNENLYRGWAEKGYLVLLPGEVIDYASIVNYVLELNRCVRIIGIGYDPYKSQDAVNRLGTAGALNVLRPVSQSYGAFNSAVESFEVCVRTGLVEMNDNPINWYCFGNAVLDEDRLENVKPVKRHRSQKIDGVITMLMCHKMFMDTRRNAQTK